MFKQSFITSFSSKPEPIHTEVILLNCFLLIHLTGRVQHGDQAYSRSPRILVPIMNTISHDMPYHTAPPPKKSPRTCSETTTTATALPSRRVGGSGSNILDTANAHTSTGKSAESRLGTGAGGLGTVTTSGSDLDVEGSDAEFLAASSCAPCQPSSSLRVMPKYVPTS